MPVATLDGRTLSICYKQIEDPLAFFGAASHSRIISTVDKPCTAAYATVQCGPPHCTAAVGANAAAAAASTSGSA